MDDIKENYISSWQLTIAVKVSDIKDDKNYFMEYEKLEGRWRGWN